MEVRGFPAIYFHTSTKYVKPLKFSHYALYSSSTPNFHELDYKQAYYY